MKIRSTMLFATILLMAASAHATIVTQTIAYDHDGVALEGHLAYDSSVSGRRPGILVVHEWWGLNDYARSRADKLARMGYVAFALDMYGKGKSTEHPDQAAAWMKAVNTNMDQWLQRAVAGLEVLKRHPQVDPRRLAAIGYCFGGATVQVLAYGGTKLKGVVSFHGSLIPPSADQAARTDARILICHGAQDPMNAPEAVSTYINAMNATAIDWQLIAYGGTRHSFTNPDADKRGMAALAYSPSADRRSWQHMTNFLDEVLAGG